MLINYFSNKSDNNSLKFLNINLKSNIKKMNAFTETLTAGLKVNCLST